MELKLRASEVDETMPNQNISAGDVPVGKLDAASRKRLLRELELEGNKMEVDGKLGREVDKMAANLKVRQEISVKSSEMINEMIMLLHEHHNDVLVDSINEETSDVAEDPEKTQKKGGVEVNEEELRKRLWWARKIMELKEKKREMDDMKTEFEETMRNDLNRMRDVLDEYSQLFDSLMDFLQ